VAAGLAVLAVHSRQSEARLCADDRLGRLTRDDEITGPDIHRNAGIARDLAVCVDTVRK
jgi:hypothetical protein